MYSITSMYIYLYRAIFVAGIFFPVLSILVLLCVYSKNVKESPKGKYFERFFKITLHSFFFFTNVHDKIRNIFEKVNLRIFIYWLIDYIVFYAVSAIFRPYNGGADIQMYFYSINWIKHLNKKIKELFIVMSCHRKQMRHKMIS